MSQRILAGNGEHIQPGEDDIISPLTFDVRCALPPIGNGTGGTVSAGWAVNLTAENIGIIEVVDVHEHLVCIVDSRTSKQAVAINSYDGWSVTGLPLSYPADRLIGGGAGGPHTHPISDVDGLQAALDAKAADEHTHVISEVTSLQATLDGKADDAHSHLVADVTGLQAALDGKAPTSHTHAISDTTGLQAALDGKAATSHTHAAADITSGLLATGRIATGTPDGTKFLRDDQTWQSAGGGGAHASTHQNGGGDEISVAGLSGLLADGQTPLAHAASHASGGSDSVKLDDWAATDDNTDLDATTTKHGLMKKFPGGTTDFLRADGAFAAPPAGGSSKSWIRADVNRTLPNDTNLNALFNNPANGRLTLTTGVYRFHGVFIITAMSSTTGNALINLLGAGTATVGSWMWLLTGLDNSTPSTIADNDAAFFQTNVTAASAVVAGTGTAMRIELFGFFECTAAGTFIPSIDQVTAAAAVLQAGSCLEVERIGDVNIVSVGAWD